MLASPGKDMYVHLCAVLKLLLVPSVFGQTYDRQKERDIAAGQNGLLEMKSLMYHS